MREPLVQSQVLPYLRRLAGDGIDVGLLTFEPSLRSSWTRSETLDWTRRLGEEGIRWHRMAYHKRPSLPATAYDIAVGGWEAARLARRHGYKVFHARAHVAATVGAVAKRLAGGQLIFDVRGFNPEEYVDAGVWAPGGAKFRIAKRVERGLLSAADGFVVLTEKAREILFPGCTDADPLGRPVEVIPCCVDLDRFGEPDPIAREKARKELGLGDRRVLIYVGALGGIYLTDELAEFVAIARERDPSTFALALTHSPPELFNSAMRRAGVPESAFSCLKAAPPDVPRYLRAADLALSFRKPSYSQVAASPTKIAEYLACGLPVVCNSGVGDVDAIIEGDRVGAIIRDLDRGGYRAALDDIDRLSANGDLASRCLSSARSRFDLVTVGGARYLRLYSRLDSPRPVGPAFARHPSWTH